MHMLESMDEYRQELRLEAELVERAAPPALLQGAGVADSLGHLGARAPLWPGPMLGALLKWVGKEAKRRRAASGTPGRELLARVSSVDIDGRYWSEWEALCAKRSCYGDLYLAHARAVVDPVLREIFLDGVPKSAVLERLGEKRRSILREIWADGGRYTLGAVELCLCGYRRCLEQGDSAAMDWTRKTFSRTVSRFPGEELPVLGTLANRGLVRLVGRVREERNRLAHGASNVTQAMYADLCDASYGAESFEQWWHQGTDPSLHRPKNVGWIAFILAAAPSR